jgi:uncharacterized protein
MPGAVKEWQILSPNPSAHAEFYTSVFGWKIDAENKLGYRMADTGTGGAPGGFWPTPAGVPAMVQLFVEVASVEDAVAKAVAHGGAVVVPPQRLPDGDEMAVLRDSQGLPFGVMRRARSR